MAPSKVVKCANCHVALKRPADPQKQDRLECPICGVGDKIERVIAEAGEYATEQISNAFGSGLEATFRNSKNMKLTKHPRSNKTYRFVVDLDLR